MKLLEYQQLHATLVVTKLVLDDIAARNPGTFTAQMAHLKQMLPTILERCETELNKARLEQRDEV